MQWIILKKSYIFTPICVIPYWKYDLSYFILVNLTSQMQFYMNQEDIKGDLMVAH